MLPELSAELCDYVLERDDSAALLDRVVRANLFVVALDEDGLWWRYHALFAEYLRLRLGDRAAALHRRAARWFERHGLHEDAVDHAAACGDVELIARDARGGVGADGALGAGGDDRAVAGAAAARPGQRATGRAVAGALAAGGLARPRVEVRRMLSRAEQTREQHPEQWTGYHETARLLLAAVYGDDDVGHDRGAFGAGGRARPRGRRHARGARDGDARVGAAAGGAGRRRARARTHDRGPSGR